MTLAAALVTANNRRVGAAVRDEPTVFDTSSLWWATRLRRFAPRIRDEWFTAAVAGFRLPLIEDVISESQGNDGPWRAGLLVAHGRPVPALAERFPSTLTALSAVPGLNSALFSILEPGTELPEHRGNNCGVLRYHLGIDCGDASALIVGDQVIAYVDGGDVLFDDTVDHAASNRGTRPRITLFCEIRRPLMGLTGVANAVTQAILARDPRYRRASQRACEWDAALNP